MKYPPLIGAIVALVLATVVVQGSFAAEDGGRVASVDRSSLKNVIAPVVVEKNVYYAIQGGSEQELRSQMCRNGCTWSDGRIYDSVTDWHVTWDYGYSKTSNACSPDSFKVTVEITYHYPKWVYSEAPPPALVEKWESYLKKLAVHETGHRDIALQAAAELTRSIDAMEPLPTCGEIDRKIREISRMHLKQLKADSDAYDAETRHGATQGVVFP